MAAMERALEVLEARGATVQPIALPLMDAVTAYGGIVSRVEAATIHAEWMRERAGDYGVHISGRMYRGYAIPATYYVEALSRRGPILKAFAAEVFAKVDVLVTPTIRPACRRWPRPTSITVRPAPRQVHGGLRQHAAVQLSRLAGGQRALRLRSERTARSVCRSPAARSPRRAC